MKRVMLFATILTSFALVLAACSSAATQAPADTQAVAQPTSSSGEEQLFVFLPKGLDNPYWDNCRKGMEDEAAKKGVKAEFLGPEVSDAAKQVSI
ncbi:MAG: hypothetical protein ABFD29_10980, partial [Anaerolineaceae bacterium]